MYWSLSSPFVWKNSSSPVILVLMPIKSGCLLTTKRLDGKLNWFIPSVETTKLVVLAVNIIGWFVVNGWFSIWIDLAGILLITLEILPKTNEVEYPTPLIVDTPTDSLGLKNTVLLTLDSNLSTLSVIVNESGKNVTAVPTVCETPLEPLSILRIFSFLNISRIFSVSVPIVMLLPIEIFSAIGET